MKRVIQAVMAVTVTVVALQAAAPVMAEHQAQTSFEKQAIEQTSINAEKSAFTPISKNIQNVLCLETSRQMNCYVNSSNAQVSMFYGPSLEQVISSLNYQDRPALFITRNGAKQIVILPPNGKKIQRYPVDFALQSQPSITYSNFLKTIQTPEFQKFEWNALNLQKEYTVTEKRPYYTAYQTRILELEQKNPQAAQNMQTVAPRTQPQYAELPQRTWDGKRIEAGSYKSLQPQQKQSAYTSTETFYNTQTRQVDQKPYAQPERSQEQ